MVQVLDLSMQQVIDLEQSTKHHERLQAEHNKLHQKLLATESDAV